MKKKRVFISGITGVMGQSALKRLIMHDKDLEIVSIVRESEKNREILKQYQGKIEIVWGDLRDYFGVKEALSDVDMIIHCAALVSPAADYYPALAKEINVGSVDNILRAIEELNLKDVQLVYIGTVAETGSRLFPKHWGRIGDPIKASLFDYYAVSKIEAERKIIESKLKYWVSLRQTGILHKGLLDMREGIMYHQPLNNVLEWITEEDSGRLIENLCLKDLPDNFWKQVYNIGGGPSCRLNNFEFMSKILGVMGIKDITKVFEPKWFASQNFHGQYFLDSDILNDILDFRRESVDDFMVRMSEELSYPLTVLKYLPSFLIKEFIMKKIAKQEHGSLYWIKHQETSKIDAFWGSLEKWKKIPKWNEFELNLQESEIQVLNHGYDESKDSKYLNLKDMKEAALFRGGSCLAKAMVQGDLDTALKWECALFHQFTASPRLVLKTGHWCPHCAMPPWNYRVIANVNPFFKQVVSS